MPAASKEISREELFLQLAGLGSDVALRQFLLRHKTLLHSAVVKQLADLVVERIRVETKHALALSDAALMIARKLRRKEDLALGLRARANALYACGDNRAAVEHHQKAIELYQSLKIWKEAGRTLSSSIQPLILLGEYDRAFQASERAREIFTKLGEPRPLASLANKSGHILHRPHPSLQPLAH